MCDAIKAAEPMVYDDPRRQCVLAFFPPLGQRLGNMPERRIVDKDSDSRPGSDSRKIRSLAPPSQGVPATRRLPKISSKAS
jgi:hypothetical protein